MPATSIETHDSTIAYLQSVSEVVAAFGTDEQHGLSDEEVRSRLERYGRNELTAEKPIPSHHIAARPCMNVVWHSFQLKPMLPGGPHSFMIFW